MDKKNEKLNVEVFDYSTIPRLVIHEAVHPLTPRMRPAPNMRYIFYRIVTRIAVGLQIA